jgi:hypothetical protein
MVTSSAKEINKTLDSIKEVKSFIDKKLWNIEDEEVKNAFVHSMLVIRNKEERLKELEERLGNIGSTGASQVSNDDLHLIAMLGNTFDADPNHGVNTGLIAHINHERETIQKKLAQIKKAKSSLKQIIKEKKRLEKEGKDTTGVDTIIRTVSQTIETTQESIRKNRKSLKDYESLKKQRDNKIKQ